jgi:septum formation protein
VLASASPARLRLLTDAGIEPLVVVSGVDESATPGDEPEQMVLGLATAKAAAVAALPVYRSELVLGADSTLVVDGVAHGKPLTAEAAVQRWQRMRCRQGTLLTGHCVIDGATGRRAAGVGSTLVHFGDPSDAEIEAYVATGEPLHVAGAFTLDGRGAPFIERIEGDPSNVVGLSLPVVRRLLAELGVGIVDLWR